MWLIFSRGAGLVIVLTVLALVAMGKSTKDQQSIALLLGIAAALLGVAGAIRRKNGNGVK